MFSKWKECPDEFHYLLEESSDLLILGSNAASTYFSITRDIAQASAYDQDAQLTPLPTYSEASEKLQKKLKSVGCLGIEEGKVKEARNALIRNRDFVKRKHISKRTKKFCVGHVRILDF